MITSGFFPHPLYPNYVANKDGYVYSLYTNKELIGNLDVNGYIRLTMFRDIGQKVVKFKHTIVWESITGTLVPTGFQIDHIDQNTILQKAGLENTGPSANNAFENLQCLSSKDHTIKTRKENPHMIKSFLAGLNRKVIRKCIYSDTVVEFDSRKDAAKSVLGTAQALGDAIMKNIPYLEFRWYNIKDQDLPGEEWLQGEISRYRVSSCGRVWPPNGYKTFGYKGPARYTIKLSGRTYGVHQLICHAFHGSKPSLQHTVDHIDGNPHNNHYQNLRYATKQEQSVNRKSVNAVEGYIRRTGETVGTWFTITEAAAATGAISSHITRVLKGRLKSCGKTSLGNPIAWRYA